MEYVLLTDESELDGLGDACGTIVPVAPLASEQVTHAEADD